MKVLACLHSEFIIMISHPLHEHWCFFFLLIMLWLMDRKFNSHLQYKFILCKDNHYNSCIFIQIMQNFNIFLITYAINHVQLLQSRHTNFRLYFYCPPLINCWQYFQIRPCDISLCFITVIHLTCGKEATNMACKMCTYINLSI